MSQVILFDLDGTLTASGEGITKCVQYALNKMGMAEDDLEKLECFIGPPLKDSFMRYGGFSQEEALRAVAYYRERYETTGIFENALYPKIPELLELLQINDKIMAVASSKPEKYVKQILEHFGIASYFQAIVGSEMDGQRVLKAEVIEEALSRLGMQTQRDKVIMVGDRAEDVLGAISCGVQCVGALYGYGTAEELKQAGAVYLAETVEDLAVLASPNDEETTEHVESIRQSALKESEEIPVQEEETKVLTTETEEWVLRRKPRPVKKMHPLHHIWRWFYPLGLYFLLSLAVTFSFGIFFAVQMLLTSDAGSVQMLNQKIVGSSLAITLVTDVLAILIGLLFYHIDQKKREQGILGNWDERWCPFIVWLSITVISIAGCQLLNDLIFVSGLHELFPSYTETASLTIHTQPFWMIFLTVVVVAPVAEEIIFRGLMFRRMKDWLKPVTAVFLSALAFGLYHGNMVQFLYAFLMGAVFAMIYHRTGMLQTSIVAHLTANFWSMFGYPYVCEFAQMFPFGIWVVIVVSALLCVIPAYWILLYKRK